MPIVSKPAQFSYQTGTPIEGLDRDNALKKDFSNEVSALNDKLPGHVQDHIRRQKAIQYAQGQQTLQMNRTGSVLKSYKVGNAG